MRTSPLVIVLLVVAAIGSLAARTPTSKDASSAVADHPAIEVRLSEAPGAESRVDAALDALDRAVTKRSHPDALRTALQAYYSYVAAHPEAVRNPYFYYVDYGLDNRTARGYVFDMETLTLVEGPFIVAHGRGSSIGKDAVPTRFSNRPGSATTSLGLYVAAETYDFGGKSGGQRYTSIGLRLDGVSGRFNSAARPRGIVVHGAPYVTASSAGRSEGCPAMEQGRARRLIPKIANGGLVFLYSPRDRTWLEQDPWISAHNALQGSAARSH